MITGIFI